MNSPLQTRSGCDGVVFISTYVHKDKRQGSGGEEALPPASFLCFIRHCGSRSGYLHGGQRQTTSDYRCLVWEMKNALVNSSHTDLFVSVGGRSQTASCLPATHSLCFKRRKKRETILNCLTDSQRGRVWVRIVCFPQASRDTRWVFVSPLPPPYSPTWRL